MLTSGADIHTLAAAGVGWVVTENIGAAGELDLPVAYRDDDLVVYAVGGDTAGSPHRAVMIGAHAVWLGQLFAGLTGMLFARVRSRHTHRRDEHDDGPERGDQ